MLAGGLSAACGASSQSARNGSSAASTSPSTSFASTDSAEIRDVRAIHRSRCGNCHVPVEPGTHTRAELESAFVRHRTRVKMNEAEWSSMIDYLASDSTNAKANTLTSAK
jgi:hypothetical protein